MAILVECAVTITPPESSALLLTNTLLIMTVVLELTEAITLPVLFQNLESLTIMLHCFTANRAPPNLVAVLWLKRLLLMVTLVELVHKGQYTSHMLCYVASKFTVDNYHINVMLCHQDSTLLGSVIPKCATLQKLLGYFNHIWVTSVAC